MGSLLGEKRPGRNLGHSLLSSAEVKNEWSYSSVALVYLRGVDGGTSVLLRRFHEI